MDLKLSQAGYFMSMNPPPTPAQLEAAGADNRGGYWMFRDGSTGRFMPMEGRFIADDDWNITSFATVQISPPLSAAELYRIWDEYRAINNTPKLVFITRPSQPVMVAFHPDHGTLGGIENIGQTLKIAIHSVFDRKYADTTVEY